MRSNPDGSNDSNDSNGILVGISKNSEISPQHRSHDTPHFEAVGVTRDLSSTENESPMSMSGWDKPPNPRHTKSGPAKGLDGTQTLTEELRCHLKVLNELGGSLSRTYACINLLTLEITNYLKEEVKNMKNLSVAKEQQNPAEK
eukprot:Gb_35312 [translate_table: standard]